MAEKYLFISRVNLDIFYLPFIYLELITSYYSYHFKMAIFCFFAPLFRAPEKVLGVGMNYLEKALELSGKPSEAEPVVFMKPNSSLIGQGEIIEIPSHITCCLYRKHFYLLQYLQKLLLDLQESFIRISRCGDEYGFHIIKLSKNGKVQWKQGFEEELSEMSLKAPKKPFINNLSLILKRCRAYIVQNN
ncbi:MAG: fumarylacetoacetate hydrolase family protein [Bacillota bacterium]